MNRDTRPARGVDVLARDTAGLLGDFELPVPTRAPIEPDAPAEKVNRHPRPRRGVRAPGAGWAAVEAPLSTQRTTTDQIGGLYPLLSTRSTPPVGAQMGYDALSGGAFYVHPVEWVLRGITTNPNMIFFGKPGSGKSSTIQGFALKMMTFGVKTLIAGDVKGEYSGLVRALGQEPIALGFGHTTRVNPLDLGPLSARWRGLGRAEAAEALNDLIGRWTSLLAALCEAQGHPVTPTDSEILSSVLRELSGLHGDPGTDSDTTRDGEGHPHSRSRSELGMDSRGPRPLTVPDVHRTLSEGAEPLWQRHRFASRQHFLDQTRPLTDALGALVNGALRGLFDEPTNITVDWNAPIQSLDLSGLDSRGEKALDIALTCLGSWSRSATDLRSDGELRIVVRDEIWRQMRLGAGMVAAVDAELRLSRAHQIISILAAHKPGDMLTVGDAGSRSVAMATGLLALCDTRVLMGQSEAVADDLTDELGLSAREQDLITGWCTGGRGRGLWKVQNAGYQVQALLTARELAVFDTNAQLRGKPRKFPESGGSNGPNPEAQVQR